MGARIGLMSQPDGLLHPAIKLHHRTDSGNRFAAGGDFDCESVAVKAVVLQFSQMTVELGGVGLAAIGVLVQGLNVCGVIHFGQVTVLGLEPSKDNICRQPADLIVGSSLFAQLPFTDRGIAVELAKRRQLVLVRSLQELSQS